MDNLEEMDTFLERCSLQRMNQEEIENMNRPLTSPEIEPVILKTPNKQTLGPGGFTGKIYQTFREVNAYSFETAPKSCREIVLF